MGQLPKFNTENEDLEHQYGDIMEAVQYCSAAKYRMYGHYGQNNWLIFWKTVHWKYFWTRGLFWSGSSMDQKLDSTNCCQMVINDQAPQYVHTPIMAMGSMITKWE